MLRRLPHPRQLDELMSDRAEIRSQILDLVRAFHEADHGARHPFRPGEDPVRYAGRVYDSEELVHLVDASLDFWLTAGRFAEEFETGLAEFLGLDNVLLVNSGSRPISSRSPR